jgi:TrmH family RNA methyltransferase
MELSSRARERRREKAFVIEGARLFADTPEDFLLETFVTKEYFEGAEEKIRDRIRRKGGVLVTPELLKKMSDTQTPQGVAAIVRMPEWTMEDLLSGNPLILVLENIQDPGNLGTMVRTAEAAGASGILMSRDTVDLFNPKTVRSTMSGIFRVPALISEDLAASLDLLKKRGVTSFAAHLGGEAAYDRLSYTGPSAFLIGNEGKGLTEELSEKADQKLLIPMHGRIESLNAAMAAGILLYEADRQRRNLS